MATWDLAVAFSTTPQDPTNDPPMAIVEWLAVEGGQAARDWQGFASFAEALGTMMSDGWEPFSAHRWEDFDSYGLHPQKINNVLPPRTYVWFRRPFKSRAQLGRDISLADAQTLRAPRVSEG